MTSTLAVGSSAAPTAYKTETASAFDPWFDQLLGEYASRTGDKSTDDLSYGNDDGGLYGEKAEDLADSPRNRFSDWVSMSLAEKLRAQYLEAKGITDEDLEAMSVEELKAIEDAITEYIKEEMKRQAGIDGRRLDTDNLADLATAATLDA